MWKLETKERIMSDRCEWVGDTLNMCDKRSEEVFEDITKAEENFPHCKWCGADIRKPEPELIIKKSGNSLSGGRDSG